MIILKIEWTLLQKKMPEKKQKVQLRYKVKYEVTQEEGALCLQLLNAGFAMYCLKGQIADNWPRCRFNTDDVKTRMKYGDFKE